MKSKILACIFKSLLRSILAEHLSPLYYPPHFLSLLNHMNGQLGYFSFGNNSDECFFEGEWKKLLLPIIGTPKAIALGKKYDVLLILNVRLPLVESHLAVEDDIEALRLLLFLIDEALLSEFGQKHRPAYKIDRRQILNLLYGFHLR